MITIVWSSLEQHAAPLVLALIMPVLLITPLRLTLPQIIPLLITAKLHLKITNISIQLLSSSTHGYRGHVIIIIIKLVFTHTHLLQQLPTNVWTIAIKLVIQIGVT